RETAVRKCADPYSAGKARALVEDASQLPGLPPEVLSRIEGGRLVVSASGSGSLSDPAGASLAGEAWLTGATVLPTRADAEPVTIGEAVTHFVHRDGELELTGIRVRADDFNVTGSVRLASIADRNS